MGEIILKFGTVVTVKETKLTDEGLAGSETLNFTGATTFTLNAGADDRISDAAGSFSALKVGMKVTISGSASNNGVKTVSAISSDGSYFDVLETLVTEGPVASTALVTEADGNVKSALYYQGDTFTRSHRVSKNREFTIDLNAIDPAFERAIRGIGLIAQGKFGTAGGLEQSGNAHRLTDSLNLIKLSLKPNDTTNPQYEIGYTNNLENTFATVSYQRVLMQDANNTHTRLIGFFEGRVADLENIDQLDVITRLLDDQQALEASYQAMARVRNLSLSNFL